jgi:nucleotide-binding universal stress UspA family protein
MDNHQASVIGKVGSMDGKPIVVAYDGSEQSDMALRWALDEGVRRASPVAIAHVLAPDMHLPGPRGRPSRLDQEAESAVDRIANESYDWGRLGIEVTGAVLDGPVAEALCEQSRTASMVVMGARGLGGFAGLRTGSVSLKVAAHAHCPVVLVRENVRAPDRRPVVAGVDDSAVGRLAVGLAFEEAALRDVALVAVRAWAPPRVPWHAAIERPAPMSDARAATEQQLVDDVVASWRERYPNVDVTTRLACVTAAHALTVASRDAQLMVIGSRGSGGIVNLALGSVSQQLLHHSLCSLMVVRGLVDTATWSSRRAAVRQSERPGEESNLARTTGGGT